MLKYPLIYRQIRKSGLVEQETLDEVYRSLYKNLSALYPESDSNQSDSFSAEVGSDTEFDLAEEVAFNAPQKSEATSDAIQFEESDEENLFTADDESRELTVFHSISFEEEITRLLPAELELRGMINHWQASQLIRSRTRFNLGSYRMVDSLGMGGYGHVFLGRPQNNGSNLSPLAGNHKEIGDVAIKVLPLSVKSENAAYKFLREAEINRDLKHSNIVHFIDTNHDGNVHYMVHEYMDGGDARELIGRQGRLELDLAVTIIVAVAQGLKYLHHRGLVHRDIKPSNILLAKNGDIKLIDMGLAIPRADKQFKSISGLVERLTQWEYHWQSLHEDELADDDSSPDHLQKRKRKVAGTPDYISPDQIRIPHIPSPLWDIYSLGCTFYLMITGIVPFPAGNTQQKMQAQLYCDPPEPRMFCPGLPESISKLILAMMAKNVENRPQTADEVIQSLRPWFTQDNLVAKILRTEQLRPATILKTEQLSDDIESHSPEDLSTENLAEEELLEVASFSAPPLSVSHNTTKIVPPPLLESLPEEPVDKITQMLTHFVLFPLIWVTVVLLLLFLVLALLK